MTELEVLKLDKKKVEDRLSAQSDTLVRAKQIPAELESRISELEH